MNLCSRIAFISLWLITALQLSGQQQPGFTAPFINNVAPNAISNVNISVSNFTNIVGIQYIIRWDPKVVKFLAIDNLNLGGLDLLDFSTANALDSGIIRMVWTSDNVLTGNTLPNATNIFRLRLQAIGPVGTSTAVIFTEKTPTIFEVNKVTANGNIIALNMDQCVLTNGFIAIGFTVNADEAIAGDQYIKVSPNPFTDKTTATFDVATHTDIQIVVTDPLGRVAFEHTEKNVSPGPYTVDISGPKLRDQGWYLLKLQVGSHTYIQPLVRL